MSIWNAIKDIVAILFILILNWCKKKKNKKKSFNVDFFLGLYVQNLQYKETFGSQIFSYNSVLSLLNTARSVYLLFLTLAPMLALGEIQDM
jgi:hypothetical protein